MKPGGAFALNPHAASYVPLYKRVDDMDSLATHNVQGQEQMFMPKKFSEVAYKQIRDADDSDLEMDIDMDIEYLLVTFSGLSEESITDVYLANGGDLEATIEMLNQLEIYNIETQEQQSETLDIGDLCKSGPSTSKASTQTKAATEVVVSSSSVIPNTTVSA